MSLPGDGAPGLPDPAVPEWSAWDETLADGPLADPPPAALPWLSQQRFVHGLLRALNIDAGTREERVAAILGSLPGRRRTPTRLLLAAAALLAVIGWAVIPGFAGLPRAEAAVARAAGELGRPLDRQFRLLVELADKTRGQAHLRSEFTFTTRPGGRFLVEGASVFGRFQAGCDGNQFWYRAGLPGSRAVTMPLADAERLLSTMGDVLDLGYLDVAGLLRRLPAGFDLRATGREKFDGQTPQVRVEAIALPERLEQRLSSAVLWFDEVSGMISRAELQGHNRGGVARSVRFDYLGVVELGDEGYSAPR